MFKKILSQFFNPKKVIEKPVHKLASLTVEVNTDGSMNILCDWPTFNDNNSNKIREIAYYYALTIHALNHGILEKDIIETLVNYDKSNIFDGLFAQNTLIELLNIEKTSASRSSNQNNPVVSPLEVFKTN
jgi:hypothetical protein